MGGMEDAVSPVLHLRLTKPATDAEAAEATLQVPHFLTQPAPTCWAWMSTRLSKLDPA